MSFTFSDLENLFAEHPMDKELVNLYLPTPSEKTVHEAEVALGVEFPMDYKNALHKWGIIFLPYAIIYGICGNDVNYFGGPNVVALTKDARAHSNLPNYYLAIFDNDGDELWCIDTRKPEGPVIAWNFFEKSAERKLADSFLSFVINSIRDNN